MVLLTELPIFNHNLSDLQEIDNGTQEERTNKNIAKETDFEDTDSGLGDSTPPSPTWTFDEDAHDIEDASDKQMYTNERSDIKFTYSKNLSHEMKSGKFQKSVFYKSYHTLIMIGYSL